MASVCTHQISFGAVCKERKCDERSTSITMCCEHKRKHKCQVVALPTTILGNHFTFGFKCKWECEWRFITKNKCRRKSMEWDGGLTVDINVE